MTDRELELRLKHAVETHTPDVLERVMSDCDRMKGQVLPMNNKHIRFPRIAAVAAAVALILGLSVFGMSRMNAGGVASIVMLDVNPSMELKLNGQREVLEANALNEDGKQILNGMKLKGTDVNTAANAIIGSLLKNGYIDELANSILISVEDTDSARGEKLRTELSEEIGALLQSASVNAAILAQYVDDDAAGQLSADYQISEGKAALVNRIRAVNPTYQTAELAALSVHELNLILSNPKNEVAEVTATGSASDRAYIGAEKAISIAVTHAGVSEKDAVWADAEFDFENGRMVYEVEFSYAGREYEYDIDAVTGEVVSSRHEYDDDDHDVAVNAPAAGDIGSDQAKAVAFAHAGVTADQIRDLEVERETDDGRLEYHVEFRAGGVKYEYEIAAADGSILEYDKDITDDDDDDYRPAGTTTTPVDTTAPSAVADIGPEKARDAAFAHAGVTAGQVRDLEVERDSDDGRLEYHVEFKVGNVEYEYEISAADGTILERERDSDN